jgi:hypothetical protein
MVAAIFPSLLHQDPRFFQSGKGGFTRRLCYSSSRIFLTRTDSGRSQFNYSEIVGGGLGAAISTYGFHPRSTYIASPMNQHMFVASDRTLRSAAKVWATQVGLDAAKNLAKEFWPNIRRKLSHTSRMGNSTIAPAIGIIEEHQHSLPCGRPPEKVIGRAPEGARSIN